MSSLTADDRKESVLRYFVLCYAVSWTFWLTASTLPAGAPRSLLFLLGTFAPGFIALGFTWRGAGRDGGDASDLVSSRTPTSRSRCAVAGRR